MLEAIRKPIYFEKAAAYRVSSAIPLPDHADEGPWRAKHPDEPIYMQGQSAQINGIEHVPVRLYGHKPFMLSEEPSTDSWAMLDSLPFPAVEFIARNLHHVPTEK